MDQQSLLFASTIDEAVGLIREKNGGRPNLQKVKGVLDRAAKLRPSLAKYLEEHPLNNPGINWLQYVTDLEVLKDQDDQQEEPPQSDGKASPKPEPRPPGSAPTVPESKPFADSKPFFDGNPFPDNRPASEKPLPNGNLEDHLDPIEDDPEEEGHNAEPERQEIEFKDDADRATEEVRIDLDETKILLREQSAPTELQNSTANWLTRIIEQLQQKKDSLEIELGSVTRKNAVNGGNNEASKKRKLFISISNLEDYKKNELSKTTKKLEDLRKVGTDKATIQKAVDDVISQITSLIEHCQIVSEIDDQGQNDVKERREIMNTIERHAKIISDANARETFTMVIVGLEKAGKSTFTNAFLGLQLVPRDQQRCTMSITIIKPAQDGQDKAVIHYRSAENLKKAIAEGRKKDPNIDFDDIERRCTPLANKPSKEIILNGEASRLKEVTEAIKDPVQMYVIEKIEVFSSQITGKNWEIIDCPGFDSPITEHWNFTANAIKKADAYIFVVASGKPNFNRDQMNVLQSLKTSEINALSRAFGVITWLDNCNTQSEFRTYRDSCMQELMRMGFARSNIFPVSARAALANMNDAAEDEKDYLDTIEDKLKNFDDLGSGFEKCKEAIQKYISFELPVKNANNTLNLLTSSLLPLVNKIITIGRSRIPDHISSDDQLDEFIKKDIEVETAKVFNERYKAAVTAAAIFKNKKIALEKGGFRRRTQSKIAKASDEQIESNQHLLAVPALRDLMLENTHLMMVVDFLPAEILLRARLRDELLKIVEAAALQVSHWLYQKYVARLVQVINDCLCPEDPTFFSTSISPNDIDHEVRTLMMRIATPIIIALMENPHERTKQCIECIQQLTVTLPTLVLKSWNDDTNTPYFSKRISQIFGIEGPPKGMETFFKFLDGNN
eukprot:TRINITY_DN1463_c0_g1_i2.p1 TRINITY_DN1463_c0_g1~~TRINITY_DN1463_c0_g1_i2.p1  ORF type:complete len:913 (+),score=287.69 TRINITY_DN1463_c0_g1_i2:37-2739(+)